MATEKKNKRIQSILGYLQNDVPGAIPADQADVLAQEGEPPPDEEGVPEEEQADEPTDVNGIYNKKKKRNPFAPNLV